jgi:hypothetical protein
LFIQLVRALGVTKKILLPIQVTPQLRYTTGAVALLCQSQKQIKNEVDRAFQAVMLSFMPVEKYACSKSAFSS